MNDRPLFAVLTFALASIVQVHAHTVWIEPNDAGQLVIRFAEPGDDFETSPGHLDSLSLPLAFSAATNKPVAVAVSKQSDGFLLESASSGSAVCAETVFTVRGGRKPIFYARWQPMHTSVAEPSLTLDLVPTGQPGEVRVYFRGEPLAGVEATVRAPDGKEETILANEEGLLRVHPSLPGYYLLTVAHYREPLAGYHLGRYYDQTSHNGALTWHIR